MASTEEPKSLGPWRDADLRATAISAAGTGADAGVPDAVRFKSAIAKLVRRRLAICEGVSEDSGPCIFLLMPSPPNEADAPPAKRVPCLDNGMHELGSRVWFVCASGASGHWVSADFEDDDALFAYVTDTLAMGQTAAILYDPKHPNPHIRHYPSGLSDLEDFAEVSVATVPITVDSVTAAIESTHAEMMVTPDAQPDTLALWTKPTKFWPYKEAEKRAQGYLQIALNTAFPTCTIRAEQPGPAGRLDIEIVENDPIERTKISQHGILELKVLRSFGSTGTKVYKKENAEAVKSGVEQAAAYRDEKKAPWGVLVCFDMQAEDGGNGACFKHVKKLAQTLDVHLRRWFLFNSSRAFRRAKATANS